MTDILVVDNYDSFTWNLVHLVGPLVDAIEVVRNDAVTVADVARMNPDAIVLSPGPGTPDDAGVTLDLIRELGPRTPMLGVCLGLQAIGQAYGGRVVRAPVPMHGKVSPVRHEARGLFRGLNRGFEATRYHSLVVAREDCPAVLDVTAETEDGLVMGLEHREHPLHGVQFHPESVRSEAGGQLLRNFLALAAEWRARDAAA